MTSPPASLSYDPISHRAKISAADGILKRSVKIKLSTSDERTAIFHCGGNARLMTDPDSGSKPHRLVSQAIDVVVP